jgi:hypothetical protein
MLRAWPARSPEDVVSHVRKLDLTPGLWALLLDAQQLVVDCCSDRPVPSTRQHVVLLVLPPGRGTQLTHAEREDLHRSLKRLESSPTDVIVLSGHRWRSLVELPVIQSSGFLLPGALAGE